LTCSVKVIDNRWLVLPIREKKKLRSTWYQFRFNQIAHVELKRKNSKIQRLIWGKLCQRGPCVAFFMHRVLQISANGAMVSSGNMNTADLFLFWYFKEIHDQTLTFILVSIHHVHTTYMIRPLNWWSVRAASFPWVDKIFIQILMILNPKNHYLFKK
jgi:hypothetical protein